MDRNWKKRYKFRYDHPFGQADKVSIVNKLDIKNIGKNLNLDDVKGTIDFFNNLPKSFQTPAEARDHLEKRKPGYSVENLDILMKNLTEDANGNLVWCYSKDACIQSIKESRSRDWWEYLPRVQCPVLLLHVEGSTELSDDVAEKILTIKDAIGHIENSQN